MAMRKHGSYRLTQPAHASGAKTLSRVARHRSLFSRIGRGEFWLSVVTPHVTLDPMNVDSALLQAALVGYENKLARINEAIAEIRRSLGQTAGEAADAAPAAPAPRRRRRKLSSAARARISAAQKKRWAVYKKSKGKS